MQLAVLGPMEVVSGAQRLALGGPKQRLVLGLLAAARRRTVTLDELVDGLWPEGPQAQPRKTVQVYITRLRRTFGDDADAIRSDAAGYRLDTSAVTTDADLFEADLDAVTPDLDDEAAVALLRSALGRWRGEAFVDLRDCPAIVPVAVRLDELRLNAMQDLFEREIRRNPRGVISELEQAVEANPLHEGFAAQLMTAQYRAGRQADALATYQALRRRLSEELGLDPGPAIRDLEGRILRHELTVAAPAATAAPERQRRRVTVLSLDLSVAAGSALDPEEELTVVAPLRQAARAQILHHGGIVLAEAGDGLTACFGFPARERSVELAVRAGMAIRELGDAARAGGAVGLRIRVGIDTGVVVIEAGREGGGADLVGIAGEPLRAATAFRDDAAPGEVFVGRETATAIAGAVEVEERDGRAIAVRPVAGRTRDSSGLVGREAEQAELAALRDAAQHRVCMVVVTGPAGIGKSTLVADVVSRYPPSDVLRLRCDRRQSVTPLHALRAALPELFDGEAEPGERSIVAALRDRWGDSPVLVVDDVDAADPSTLDVLANLLDQLPNGLVLLTSRATGPLRIGDSIVRAVPLLPLDRAAGRLLASKVAAGTRLSLDTLNEIAERSGGIPLYIEAVTRAVLDSSRPGGAGTGSVPATLYDSLMADLDRLGRARVSVQRCSVLGTEFGSADVDLLGGAAEVAAADLATAVTQGVLIGAGAERFRFAHDLTATAAYESLLKSERAALHARVAERFPRERARAEPERLAFHLEAAGRLFEAAVAWRRASTTSITANRHVEARQHARRAISLLDSIGETALPDGGDNLRRSLVNLAVSLQATSHGSSELRDVIQRLRDLDIDATDEARAVVVRLIDVSNRQAMGDFDTAERVARETLDMAARSDEASTAFARQFLGATLVWCGRLAEGGDELEQAAHFWEGAAAPGGSAARAFGALWSQLGLVAHFEDRAADAATLFGRARDTIPVNDGYGRCLVGATRATVEQLAGHTDAVRADIEPLWSLAMDLASDFWLRWAQMLLGWATSADPDPSAAANGLAMMAEVLDDESATRQAVPYFAHLMASRHVDHAHPDAALDRVDAGLAIAEATGERLWVPLLHLVRSRAHAGAGRRREASAALAQSATLAAASGQAWVTRLCRELEGGPR